MRIRMMVMTTISSSIVHPRLRLFMFLPIGVSRSVERRPGGLAVDVEDVLAAPGGCVGIVLDGAQAPFGIAGHGVQGNAAKKADMAVGSAGKLNAVHESFQIGRIALGANLHLNLVFVGRV